MKKLILIAITGILLSSCNLTPSVICGRSYTRIVRKELENDNYGKFSYKIESYTPEGRTCTIEFYSDSNFNVGDTLKINKF